VQDLDILETLAHLPELPTLLIFGSQDPTLPPAVAGRLFEAIQSPRKRLVYFTDAGHGAAFRSDPEKYLTEMDGFLEEVLTSASP
jgi:pimeloyl-ACP methyl ester carboxylesterase